MAQLPDDEPTLASIRAEFPDADVVRTSNGMHYAKHDAVVIAADVSTIALADSCAITSSAGDLTRNRVALYD